MAPTVGAEGLWLLAKHRAIVVTPLFLKMGQNLVNDRLIFDTGDDLNCTTETRANFHINIKHFLTAEPRSWPFVVCLLLNPPFVYLSRALLV
jgi:hypothetical protein